jgi:hypothetical protein
MARKGTGPKKPQKPTGITHVAAGTPADVIEFGRTQLFSSAERIEPVPSTAPRRDLQRVIAELHDSELNVGMQTFFDAGVRIWFGDEMNGREAEATLTPRQEAWRDDASLAHWLHETALRLFPESDYAQRHRVVSVSKAANARARDAAAPPRGRARRPGRRK